MEARRNHEPEIFFLTLLNVPLSGIRGGFMHLNEITKLNQI